MVASARPHRRVATKVIVGISKDKIRNIKAYKGL
jgi:hypothetical protein